MDYTYKTNDNNKLLNESSFTIEEFCYDNDIEDPRTFIRILRQLCDFDDIEQADNRLLRKALVKYQQTLKESSDYIYKAKIGDKLYLQGNSQDGWDTTSDPDEAAIFESKTEPTQIINQMKKDGKISKNDKITVLMKESTIKEAKIKTPFGKMQVVDEFVIQDDDKLAFVQKAEAKYKELDKDGWFDPRSNEPYWYAFPYNRAKFTLCISKSLGKACFIDYRKEGYDNLFNESNVVIAPWKRERAEMLIEEANKIDPSYSFVEYDIGPKKEIKYKIFKNNNEYVGTFDVFTDDPYNSPYRYFFHHVNVGGLEFQGMTIDEFNKDFNEFIELDERVGHKALNEARVFSHSSGFGLSGHYNDYETPRKEPLYIATETNGDDGELYFDERGCTTEFKTDAKRFTSEEDALEFAKNNVIFGEPGAKLYEKSEYKEKNTMKKLFDYVLNESSSALKENVSSLEWLLDKAYVSEYRMVGKNSAEVRVRHTPELLTSDSMAARFEEDIPDGYKLEVDYLGEDPILGRNFDIYEVQLIKD